MTIFKSSKWGQSCINHFIFCILIYEFSDRGTSSIGTTSLKNIDVFKDQLKTTTDAYKRHNGLQTQKEIEFMKRAKE